MTRLAIEPAVAPAEEIRQAIQHHYGGALPDRRRKPAVAAGDREPGQAVIADDEAPVIRLVETILRQAVGRRASDIHFEPLESGFASVIASTACCRRARIRPAHLQRPVMSRLKIMASMNIAEKRLPQDGRARDRRGGPDA